MDAVVKNKIHAEQEEDSDDNDEEEEEEGRVITTR